MPVKQITNDYGAWSAGASWQLNQIGNTGSQFVVNFVNGSGATLYTGDVVALATTDPTGVTATTLASAQSPLVIGVVGGETNMAAAGGPIPLQTTPTRIDTNCSITNGSPTVNDAQVVAADVGKGVSGPGIPVGAYIISVVAGTSFTMNVNGTLTTGTGQVVYVGPRQSSVGPGWLAIPVGEVMPVVIQGWAYINVGANTVASGNFLSTSAAARIAAVAGTPTFGNQIGIALEAQNGPGVITSGDGSASVLVRAWITKF